MYYVYYKHLVTKIWVRYDKSFHKLSDARREVGKLEVNGYHCKIVKAEF